MSRSLLFVRLRWPHRVAFVALIAALMATSAQGQLPVARLSTVFPAGGKVGTTFDVTITGTDLEQASKLLFTHAGITATPKTRDPGPFEQGPHAVAHTLLVEIDAGVP